MRYDIILTVEAHDKQDAATAMNQAMSGISGYPVHNYTMREKRGQFTSEEALYDLYLTDAGPKKIQCIKEVRAMTGLGLKEAKDLVDRATPIQYRDGNPPRPGIPQLVVSDIEYKSLEKHKRLLEECGAKIEIQCTSFSPEEVEAAKKKMLSTHEELSQPE